jgi:hypothetical protein
MSDKENRRPLNVRSIFAHVRRGGTSHTAQAVFTGRRSGVLEVMRRAAATAVQPTLKLPEDCCAVHKTRLLFLCYQLDLISTDAVIKSLERLQLGTRSWKLAVALLSGHHLENFVREMDRGSRCVWRMVAASPSPLWQFVIVVACRAYLVSGSRIASAEQLMRDDSIDILTACHRIGPGTPHEQPYKVWGRGPALTQKCHSKNKKALLCWLAGLLKQNLTSFSLWSVTLSSQLVKPPGVDRAMPFAAMQVTADVLRVESLRKFCGLVGPLRQPPPSLVCCGTGCLEETQEVGWEGITMKAKMLTRDSEVRRRLALLDLHLDMALYTEHADCAERKFYDHVEDKIASAPVNWRVLLLAWGRERDFEAYRESYRLQKRLAGLDD